ncbi:hypothetical protein [Kibdelosporangium persicum]|nr:hypothetical protein [Kibdelosporangium persicum]
MPFGSPCFSLSDEDLAAARIDVGMASAAGRGRHSTRTRVR